MDETALLILKAPKSSGGDYYYAEISGYRYGNQAEKNESPAYYAKLFEDKNCGK